MFNQKKIAIMGTGNIAKIMARTIKRMKNVKCYAVASRDMDRAQAFAKEFGVKRAYGSYEEIIDATIKSNPGMDACTGLYDIYHGGK